MTTERRNYLVSEPNFHNANIFTERVLAMEVKKTETLMNKPVYLGLSILELNKIVMYEFWYDYVKPKYSEKAKLCYMDTDSFIVYIKTNDIFIKMLHKIMKLDLILQIMNYQKEKKVIGLMKDELGGKIITKFVELRGKTYSHLIDDSNEDKKAKGTEKCVIKRKLRFENYKNCLEATQLQNKINHLETNDIEHIK